MPGGSVPISVTYTPTDDAGNEVTIDIQADSLSFEGCVVAVICDGGTLHNVTLAQGSGSGAAPLTGDRAINVPLDSDTIILSTITGEIARAEMNGSLSLGPVPSGAVPGLGGGAAVVGVTGATSTSPVIVPGFGVTEWQTAGQTNTVAVTLGAAADATRRDDAFARPPLVGGLGKHGDRRQPVRLPERLLRRLQHRHLLRQHRIAIECERRRHAREPGDFRPHRL